MSNESSTELTQSVLPAENDVWPDSWMALFGMEHDENITNNLPLGFEDGNIRIS